MEISLKNPTGRKTNAHVVTIGDREYFFSYETCIGYRGWTTRRISPETLQTTFTKARISNSWGPTTGRHFNELGCGDFPIVSQKEFEEIIEGSLG
jgi:hypothetical protein